MYQKLLRSGCHWLLCVGALLPVLAHAALEVAQIAPMTGPISEEGKASNTGIQIALDAVNASGGIRGEQIALRTLDDKYDPDRTIELMMQEGRSETLALLMPVGSPSMTRVLREKVADKAHMPIVGVIPGAAHLRDPLNPFVFHVRAGDLDQYRVMVRHALTSGMNRVAVVYADIPFGKGGLAEIEKLLKAAGHDLTASAAFPISPEIDFSGVVATLRQATPDVVILVSPGQPAGQFIRQYRSANLAAPVMGLSYALAETICRIAGEEKAKGTIVAQVFPNALNRRTPLARRFQDDFRRFARDGSRPTQSIFEGYVTALVLVEALRRTEGRPSRDKLMLALESLRKTDLGGFVVDFSSSRHTGSEFVDIGIISNGCSLVY